MKITVNVPAGSYYLGDPCYSVQDEEWYSVVKDMYDEKGIIVEGKIVNVSNGIAMSFSTSSDGSYYDDQNNMYPVDSGSIGLVSVEHNSEFTLTDLVRIVDFSEDTECTFDGEIMTFGNIVIDLSKNTWDDAEEEDSFPENVIPWTSSI